jgi:hypothetical protein
MRPGASPVPLTAHPVQRWFVRAVLALALASPAGLFFLARGLNADRPYTLDIAFTSSVDGFLQVFYDRGAGISEAEAVAMDFRASGAPVVLGLKLPAGTYTRFRIDPPGTQGRFEFTGLRVRDWNANVVANLPLSQLVPASQLGVVARGASLIVESPPGSNDPQLMLTPASPLVLRRNPKATWSIVVACLAVYVALWAALQVAGHLLVPFEARAGEALARMATGARRRPTAAVVSAAVAGTLAAMYPVVFLGASLATPNNGGAALLYDQPPYSPGQTDMGVEGIRGSDNGAGMWQFVPYSTTQRLALSDGEIPLWNRYNGSGRPLWGQGQSQMLDPLHWVTMAVPDPGLGWDIKFVLHRVLFASGIGMAVLALTGSWPAASLVALVAPFAGYFLFRLNHAAQFSFSYAGWMLWAWFQLADAATLRDLARAGRWLAFTTAMVLVASPPKEAVVTLLCLYATGTLACGLSRPGPWRRLGTGVLAGVGALLLAAPNWLVFAKTLSQSFTDYDTPFARFATAPFAVAFAFGALPPGGLLPSAHVVAAVCAVAAVVAGRSTWGRGTTAAVALGPMLAIAVAFGAVPEKTITSTPFLANIYQIDYTFMGAAVVLTFVAAGVGIAALFSPPASGTRWPMARTTAPVLACAAGSAMLLSDAGGLTKLNLYVETWVLIFAAVLGTLLVPLLRLAALRWPAPMPAAAVVVVAGLLVAPNGLHRPTGIPLVDNLAIQPRARARLTAPSPAVQAIHRDMRAPARVIGVGDVLFSGTQGLWDLEGIAGPDALELPKYEALINAAGVQRYWRWNILIGGPDLPRVGPLLDLLNVGYLVVPHRTASQGLPPGADNLPVMRASGEDLLLAARRPTAWPRAFFVDRVERYTDVRQFVAQLNQADGPFVAVEEAGPESGETRPAGAGALAGVPTGSPDAAPDTARHVEPATNYRLTANRTRFRVHASGPGVAALTETWMADDFVATLNGTVVPYLRVNHAFKGVQIPGAGDWTIEFRYRPALWGVSWTMAALGVAAIVASRMLIR